MSTTGRNRSILAGLVAEAPVTETPSPPALVARPPDRLSTRLTGLSRVTSGDVREKTLLLVDPARCRMWSGHNRRYDLLSERSCADLVESLRSQGEQEFPAIVRRLQTESEFDYEVICGARRHWSVSFLRTVEHRDIRFLIEVRDLDDEAAFRLADVENRSRKDICDYERAVDYRNAVEVYYGGKARLMAQRMEVQESWLSRFLELAKLPIQVVEAYGDIEHLKERHARALKPLIASDRVRPLVMAEAKRLAAEQARRKEAGEPVLDGARVLDRLKRAAVASGKAKAVSAAELIKSPTGAPLFTLTTKGSKTATLELALGSEATNAEFQTAFESLLARLRTAG